MGILSGLFKSRDKPENKLSNNSHSFFVGQSSSGKRVNEKTAKAINILHNN